MHFLSINLVLSVNLMQTKEIQRLNNVYNSIIDKSGVVRIGKDLSLQCILMFLYIVWELLLSSGEFTISM